MGEPESSLDESGDLLRRDCLRALGFGVDGSLVMMFAEANLFRFEADLGAGSSTKTAGLPVINTMHKTRRELERTRRLEAKGKRR